jgi:Galactose-3-O-sulfotransferase
MGRSTTPLKEARRSVRATIEPTLIYLHIGKTAGVTLHQVLRRQFSPSQTLWLHRSPIERGQAAKATAGAERDEEEAVPSEDRPIRERSLAYVASLPREELARVRLIEGHTIYGLHRCLPRPAVYATLLREPVARVISGYGYIRRRPGHPLHALSHRLSLDEFLRSGNALQLDNGQTRAIAGDTRTAFGECTHELAESAKRNIEEHFAVVGLTEWFDESLLLMRRAFGWRNVHYVPANVSRRSRSSREVDTRTRRVIEELNQLDVELYEWTRERVGLTIEAESDLDEELRRFRAVNILYRPWGHLTYTLPRAVLMALRSGGARRTTPDS